MSRVVVLLLALAGCQTQVHELEPGDGIPEGRALIAGRLAFRGTKVYPTLRLLSEDGRAYRIALGDEVFLVALPPGYYTVRDFGGYQPSADTLTIEAPPEGVSYIGSFQPARDSDGDLCFKVADECEAIERVLEARYGDELPALADRRVQSSLDPTMGDPENLVVAVAKPSSRTSGSVSFGIGFGTSYRRTSLRSTTRSGTSSSSYRGSYSRARTRVSASSTRYSARPSRSR